MLKNVKILIFNKIFRQVIYKNINFFYSERELKLCFNVSESNNGISCHQFGPRPSNCYYTMEIWSFLPFFRRKNTKLRSEISAYWIMSAHTHERCELASLTHNTHALRVIKSCIKIVLISLSYIRL